MICNPKSTFKRDGDKMLMELEFDRVWDNEMSHITIHNIVLDSVQVSENIQYAKDCKTVIEFNCLPTGRGWWFTEQIKEKEMTLEQIEKQLGYKIKIVNK